MQNLPPESDDVIIPVPVFRQMRLLAAASPLRERFPQTFFLQLPRQPGVYFFRDAEGRLLYVGQSHDLRKRVGSYRHIHPDRHPKRLVRLVHQVRQIEWEVCESPAAAVERERELLLELRPGFNRAGVWQPPPWWLVVGAAQGAGGRPEGVLRMELRSGAIQAGADQSQGESELAAGQILLGPFKSPFRWVHAAMVRCLHRWLFPEVPFYQMPAGLMGEKVPRSIQWELQGGVAAVRVVDLIQKALAPDLDRGKEVPELLTEFAHLVPDDLPPMEKEFWSGQVEVVAKFDPVRGRAEGGESVAGRAPEGASLFT